MRNLKVVEMAARKTGKDMLAAQKKQTREVVAALIDELGEEAAFQGIDAVFRTQRAKPKEGNGAEARKGKDGEEAKAGRETNEKEEAKAGRAEEEKEETTTKDVTMEAGEAAPASLS